MTFYRSGATIREAGQRLVEAILSDIAAAGLKPDNLGVTLVVHSDPALPEGFAHNGDRQFYPCSVVKVFWMAACLDRLMAGRVKPHPALDPAMHDMIRRASNTATHDT